MLMRLKSSRSWTRNPLACIGVDSRWTARSVHDSSAEEQVVESGLSTFVGAETSRPVQHGWHLRRAMEGKQAYARPRVQRPSHPAELADADNVTILAGRRTERCRPNDQEVVVDWAVAVGRLKTTTLATQSMSTAAVALYCMRRTPAEVARSSLWTPADSRARCYVRDSNLSPHLRHRHSYARA